ncbi:MAG TPA: hypothetical protein VLU41_15175 [Ideonella sp.]|nr:hypothetical protein [Ideonella sp.]
MTMRHPWWAYALLLDPDRVEARLAQIAESGLVARTPNLWQLALGVVRMAHRVAFRSDTVGTCDAPVRATWRARLLSWRALRLPFLLAERAVAPLDFSGLLSSRERVLRHLLGAHHDRHQFAYDLQMLSIDPGALDELWARAGAVVRGEDPRDAWLRDLTVFDGYHESFYAAAERARAGDLSLPEPDASDPDISFLAYLDWCAAQPPTPRATLAAVAARRFRLPAGVTAPGATAAS